MTTPLGARDAALRILEDVRPQPALRVPLDDALGSVLADDIASPLDIPAWTNSAMDGYATRADDVHGASDAAPVRLRVVEEIPAGHFPTRVVGPGECARIFTGAPLPEGADGVVRQEDTDEGKDVVTIHRTATPGPTCGTSVRTSVAAPSCSGRVRCSVPRNSVCWPRSPWPTRWCTGARASRSWAAATRSSTWTSPRRS